MTILEAVILGAVQGLTEFLPVSSSGHLVLIQQLMHIETPSLFFDTMLHLGTLLAVFIVLWSDIWDLLRQPVQPLTSFLVLATIPAVVVALFLRDFIEASFESPDFLGIAFLITGLVLFVAEYISKRPGRFRSDLELNGKDALIIGIMQSIALFPGISRSGFTLAGALSRRLERGFAARFSFLLSIPAIIGALVLQIQELPDGISASVYSTPVIVGTFTAALVGFISIKVMLKLIQEHSVRIFACYTAILGIVLMIYREY
ncbi:MAG: undecaprenyl-diphosphate phosphatase [Spirochaetaceae bacterium]|jgi:undecaprenyl-diphosphatase|nr:undecaprenyl-diphosphate phosphatase [Spirochaetaceae bacterium]